MGDDTNTATPLLDEAALREGAAALKYFHNVRCVSSVDSTNALALSLLDDTSAPGLTIFADVQTAGRGRAGRTWASPGGAGLLMSTIMPIEMPQSALPALGYWTSLCAADAIIDACGVWPTLKWPNDLMLGALKIAGVLIEGRTLGAFTRAVIGLGVNANRPPEVPADLEGAAAWLSDASGSPIDRTALALAILRAYDRRYDSLIAKPLDAIREWSRRSAISGRTLRVSDAQGEPLHEGIARGLSDDGALLLETKDGPVAVRLGDVSAL